MAFYFGLPLVVAGLHHRSEHLGDGSGQALRAALCHERRAADQQRRGENEGRDSPTHAAGSLAWGTMGLADAERDALRRLAREGLRGAVEHGRVPAAESEEVVAYLREREMVTEVYDPRWLHLRTRAGPVTAAAFVVDRGHKQYAGRLPLERVADMIAQGAGNRGSCLQYLENTVRHLEALGLSDPTLKRLLHLVRARREGAGQTHLEWPQEVQRSQPS